MARGTILGIPLPPIIAPNPVGQVISASDAAVPDQTVHLSKLLEDTGWGPKNGQDQKIARGIVYAESSGKPDNVSPGGCCIGLFMVNADVWKGDCGIPSDKSSAEIWLKDPVNNSKAAKCIKDKNGWVPWDTYRNGAYKVHPGFDPMIHIKKDALTSVNNAIAGAIGNNPLSALADLVSALFNPFTYFRIGKGLLGGVILVIGTFTLVFLIANKVSGSSVGQTVKKGAAIAAVA